MYKFLYGLVLFFVLCLGIGVYGMLYPSTPRAYEDPITSSINACYHNLKRIQRPTTESHKAELMWWCIRRQSRIN